MGCELTVLAVLSVLTILLFPAAQGPYPVVHGPASTLQAARSAAGLRIAIARGATSVLGKCLIPPLAALPRMAPTDAEAFSASGPEYDSILRC
jgi:hypothetical protein